MFSDDLHFPQHGSQTVEFRAQVKQIDGVIVSLESHRSSVPCFETEGHVRNVQEQLGVVLPPVVRSKHRYTQRKCIGSWLSGILIVIELEVVRRKEFIFDIDFLKIHVESACII